MSQGTLLEHFFHWEKHHPDQVFLRQPIQGQWHEYTWRQVGQLARDTLASFQSLGLERGDRIAILSANCAQWFICDLAILMGGFISVPLYANVNASTMVKILDHSESKAILIGKLLDKDWSAVKQHIPKNIHTLEMDGYPRNTVRPWNEWVTTSGEPEMTDVHAEDVCTIIYTSGTTGDPKGVVHTHQSILNAIKTAAVDVKLDRPGNRFVSYLPLSHAAERGLTEGGSIYSGGVVSFIESQVSFMSNLQDIQPTHFFGVPRIWEKIQSQILIKMPQKKLDRLLRIPLVSTIVKSRILRALGLKKAEVIISGAAPLSAELIRWYRSIGLVIREAYGMSENFNVLSMNPSNDIRPGTVGKLFPGQDIVIDPETHEILQKCSWSMKEYYKEPKLTAEVFKDGYLHTGDMGSLTDDQFLTITGRVKDIFKTSKGEYITPSPIELAFQSLAFVDQTCVVGSLYSQPFVLVGLSETGKSMDKEMVKKELTNQLKSLNQQYMGYQRLKLVVVVEDEWTSDNGLLTPSLKMKRNEISKKYEEALAPIYDQSVPVAWESEIEVLV
ncbi:AMP-binding protein [Marinoscillum sp. MHG1-6]|uniref:AMP-binding protein n=1 Tax=Marinoscillum sp. MHG1-6 TaxID=2959627 RepID=UPI00215863A3|nr:AMP-binding protein [Marinoscillum sp. MHG1-6]